MFQFCKVTVLTLALMGFSADAHAFCGFYVAKADTQLFNKASKVIVARKDEKTVVTMASDYQGDPKEFAVVIPVPTVIKKEQIHITENKLVDQLDAYSAPRLVEYFDPDPCHPVYPMASAAPRAAMKNAAGAGAVLERAEALGVKIEAEYTVGEYDIQLLSAKESDGLQTFLNESGYQIPKGAGAVLSSYLKQGMKFFVAKVNLKERAKLGFQYLRPIQVAYETEKFMLPIRLGTVNADGPQELFIFMLTEKGRVETTNYRTIKVPSDANVPLFTKAEFGPFYKAMFDTQVKKDDMRAVYLEYAWNMAWCDPCAADPLPNDKLMELGAFWIEDGMGGRMPRRAAPGAFMPRPQNAFITRLHVRYDREHFPEDLMFHETSNQENFQGRYVLRHPYTGEARCDAGKAYRRGLGQRFKDEAETLASLTGWEIATIREKMAKAGQPIDPETQDLGDGKAWYQRMWEDEK
jgi:hypothetical protein